MSALKTKSVTQKNDVATEEGSTAVVDDVDFILADLGESSYARFQFWIYVLFSIPILMGGLISIVYVFTTLNVDYRCYIPECDDIDYPQYDADWLEFVISHPQTKPSKCHRFASIADMRQSPSNLTEMDKLTFATESQTCSLEAFNRSHVIRCDEDGFVYRTDEISIANEFGIMCEENEWQLVAVGAYNNIVRLVCMPLVGIISDRYGRRTILLISLVLSSVAGIIQSYSISYTMFIICEIFCAIVACPIFTSALVLGLEWAGTKERVMVNSIITFPLHFGIALIGVLAWFAKDFRLLLRMVYGPALFVAFLVCFGPESFRWLMAKGKRESIEKILKQAAKINKRELSPRTFEIIDRKCNAAAISANESPQAKETANKPLRNLLASRTVVVRAMINALCWITGNYVSQGITIIAVSLQGGRYFNFIILAIGGVPAGFISILLLKYVGRRSGISICLLIASAAIILAKLIPNEYENLTLILLLVGRCFVMVAYLIVWVQTSELWPTCVRHTMVGVCSTLGRLGSVMAPLSPLLSNIAEILPFLSYGAMSLLPGLLVLLLPETSNTKLPDTIDDAKRLGKRTNKSAK